MSLITIIVIVLAVALAVNIRRKGVKKANDNVIFGVCGGLAKHYDWPVAAVRILAVLTLVVGGAGLITYLVLAVILERETAAK